MRCGHRPRPPLWPSRAELRFDERCQPHDLGSSWPALGSWLVSPLRGNRCLYTQGPSRREATANLAEAIELTADRKGMKVTVTKIGGDSVLVSANHPACLPRKYSGINASFTDYRSPTWANRRPDNAERAEARACC
jgi:hypothetical protein